MKHRIQHMVAMLAFVAGGATLCAQPAIKLVTVNMAELLNDYWKTKEASAKFEEDQKKYLERRTEQVNEGNALVQQYNELKEQIDNPAITEEARKKAVQDIQLKAEEIQRKQIELQNSQANFENQMQQRIRTHRRLMFDEIGKVVKEIAAKKGATLVIDISGPSLFEISPIVYSDAAYEITKEVSVELNKDKPAPAPAAPAPAAPAAPAPEVKK